jgi:hypothetical protein
VIDAALGVVFDSARPPEQAWPLVRAVVVEGLVQQGLQTLSRTDLADARLDAFRNALAAEATAIATGGAWDPAGFAARLAAALA